MPSPCSIIAAKRSSQRARSQAVREVAAKELVRAIARDSGAATVMVRTGDRPEQIATREGEIELAEGAEVPLGRVVDKVGPSGGSCS